MVLDQTAAPSTVQTKAQPPPTANRAPVTRQNVRGAGTATISANRGRGRGAAPQGQGQSVTAQGTAPQVRGRGAAPQVRGRGTAPQVRGRGTTSQGRGQSATPQGRGQTTLQGRGQTTPQGRGQAISTINQTATQQRKPPTPQAPGAPTRGRGRGSAGVATATRGRGQGQQRTVIRPIPPANPDTPVETSNVGMPTNNVERNITVPTATRGHGRGRGTAPPRVRMGVSFPGLEAAPVSARTGVARSLSTGAASPAVTPPQGGRKVVQGGQQPSSRTVVAKNQVIALN